MLFNETQWKTLEAVCNRLIPADEFPAAWEVGVGDYLERLLAGDCAHLQANYRVGLDAVEAEAWARFGTAYAELFPEQQDELLYVLETGETRTEWRIPSKEVLAMFIHHTAEGYYSDPANGGNRGGVAWEMIGFEKRRG